MTGCVQTGLKKFHSNKPHFFDEFEKIYKVLLESTYSKSDVELIAPKSGENQLAINQFTDKLNRSFAVTFYKNKLKTQNLNNELRMVIMQKNNNVWQTLINKPCHDFNKIEKIIFTQNKNNTNPVLIVGYSGLDQNRKHKTNYRPSPEKFFLAYEIDPSDVKNIKLKIKNLNTQILEYDNLDLLKLNGSQEKKLVAITQTIPMTNPNQNTKYIRIFDIFSDRIQQIKSFEIPATGFLDRFELKLDTKSFNQPAIFLHKKTHSNNSTSIFLIKDDLEIKKIYETKKDELVYESLDFDNDGCIEIPVIEPFPGYKAILNSMIVPDKLNLNTTSLLTSFNLFSLAEINSPKIVNWTKFGTKNGNLNQQTTTTYTNFTHGYGLKLPKTWSGKITAQHKNKNKTVEFFEFNGNLSNSKNKILTISTCHNDEKLPQGFFKLIDNGPFSFIAKIHNSNFNGNRSLLISENYLKQSFFLINQTNNLKQQERND